jgi:hypothetical protein
MGNHVDTNSHSHIIDQARYWLSRIDTRDPDLHRLLRERNMVVTSIDGGRSAFRPDGAFPAEDYPKSPAGSGGEFPALDRAKWFVIINNGPFALRFGPYTGLRAGKLITQLVDEGISALITADCGPEFDWESARMMKQSGPMMHDALKTLEEARQYVESAGDDEDPEAQRNSAVLLSEIDAILKVTKEAA